MPILNPKIKTNFWCTKQNTMSRGNTEHVLGRLCQGQRCTYFNWYPNWTNVQWHYLGGSWVMFPKPMCLFPNNLSVTRSWATTALWSGRPTLIMTQLQIKLTWEAIALESCYRLLASDFCRVNRQLRVDSIQSSRLQSIRLFGAVLDILLLNCV